jgi:hypothetical protein
VLKSWQISAGFFARLLDFTNYLEHGDELICARETQASAERYFYERIKRSMIMRRNLSLAILATVSALTAVGSMAPVRAAEAMQDSYCLQGRLSGYPGNCEFASLRQCMATASGTGEGCGINPMKIQQNRGPYQNRPQS